MRKYRFFDHTGDEGVIAYGATPAELLENAAKAFYAVLSDPRRVRTQVEEQVHLTASGYDNLLISWLKELLFLFDTRMFLGRRIDIEELEPGYLSAVVRGETYAEERHVLRRVIKAVTYHQLEVTSKNGRWRARFVLDL